jgi:uncharacterized protein (DUF58 family)
MWVPVQDPPVELPRRTCEACRVSNLVPEALLEKLGKISITARQAVESVLSGAHRSVHRGLSVEFAGHREYTPGDDLRYLDWLVYARTDRFDIRQYEEETKLKATLLLDVSGSMGYRSGGQSKLDYARSLAAVLAVLMVRQADSVGLLAFDDRIRAELGIGSTTGHLLQVLEVLERTVPGSESGLAGVLTEIAGRLPRRGLVVLLTDTFEETEALVAGLRQLRYRRQDVRVLQIIDPVEREFPFRGMTEFVGLEREPRLRLDADRMRRRYLDALARHERRLAEACQAAAIGFDRCLTSEDLVPVVFRTFGEHQGWRTRSGRA